MKFWLCFPSDYAYIRDPDTNKCSPSKDRSPELCIHGDVEKLRDTRGYVELATVLAFFCPLLSHVYPHNEGKHYAPWKWWKHYYGSTIMLLEVMFTLKKSALISLVLPIPIWRAAECDVGRLALGPKPYTGSPARSISAIRPGKEAVFWHYLIISSV